MAEYTWTQKFNEIEISFKKPSNASKISFSLQNKQLIIYDDRNIIFEDTLFLPPKKDSAYWYKEDDILKFYFEKQTCAWWESLVQNGPKVDVEKLAQENVISDFSVLNPEERSMVEKMMFESKNKKN